MNSAVSPVQAIGQLAPEDGVAPLERLGGEPAGEPGRFGALVGSGLEAVNRDLLASQVDLQQLAVGNAENLHQIMIRLEESRLSFQLLMQVRGRLLEAYQDVMKMQI
jgi:flagellar hook-basal body complex protein FliE